jgi:hypothetical protein
MEYGEFGERDTSPSQVQGEMKDMQATGGSLPSTNPIIGKYGEQRPGHIHHGTDYGVSSGTPISVIQPGTVADAGFRDDGYGNLFDVSGLEDDYINLNYITSLYFANATPDGVKFVGNIFYAHGIVVLTNQSASYQALLSNTYTSTAKVSFQNEHIIYENEVRCIVRESDFNLTYNPTLLKYGNQYIVPISGSPSNVYTTTGSFDNTTVKDFATGSFFQPYVTTIGLYNDDNELLMVAKLGKPIMLSPDTDMTFIVKYDT